ncbi:MAG: DoxX family protein [Gemmatales bacterium]
MQTLRTLSAWLMGLLYLAAGINHFWHPGFYLNIMPPYIPEHALMVQLSGVAEIVLGLMMLLPRYRKPAAWGIIAMLIAFMTVHIHMVQNAHLFKDVPEFILWLRIPLQFLLILWAFWYTRPITVVPATGTSISSPSSS